MGLHAHALKSAERTEENKKGLRLEQKVAGSLLLKIIFFRRKAKMQTFWKILNFALNSQNIYILAYHLTKNGTSRSRGERASRSKAAWREIDLFRLQEYTSD